MGEVGKRWVSRWASEDQGGPGGEGRGPGASPWPSHPCAPQRAAAPLRTGGQGCAESGSPRQPPEPAASSSSHRSTLCGSGGAEHKQTPEEQRSERETHRREHPAHAPSIGGISGNAGSGFGSKGISSAAPNASENICACSSSFLREAMRTRISWSGTSATAEAMARASFQVTRPAESADRARRRSHVSGRTALASQYSPAGGGGWVDLGAFQAG